MLTGGLIHLVHQLAVVATLLPEAETPIAILITGVLRKQPAALAALHADLERWLAVLRHRHPVFAGIRLAAAPEALAWARYSAQSKLALSSLQASSSAAALSSSSSPLSFTTNCSSGPPLSE